MTRPPTAPPPDQVKPPAQGVARNEERAWLGKTPRASASWFLRGDELQPILSDPGKVANRLLAALPADARAAIIAFAEFGLTGSVSLNFSEGQATNYESREHHRLGAA